MSVEDNKAVIRRIYAALETGDNSVFGASVHPDYVWRFPSKASWSDRYEGQEDVRSRLIGPLFNQFASTYTARLINLVAEGDIVVAEIEGDVETKSGVRYDNQYCMLFHFRNGKIREVVEYCDTDLEERALGRYDDAVAAYKVRAQ
jgi:uncharacterized protein